ncbi:DUF1467 family protein [Sphingomonas sanxanigenens]|uniref:Uncharacterized protein n=1 Tax=Sphingomonas sanxanigenens DSM 19645 = NX02 TaxID=1123269 RepID=W0AEL0_9SPHN|nr:DUF1467 family protein [Sphingomonas sanxanigenens]AHE56354.1 hypothetical protein NX02_23710 [Sphingomonas sanxanigenens DSM 19645 = NX02]
MSFSSALAIYLLFWVMTGFVVLPFGVRTADEMGVEKVPGQADSAPANFRPGRVVLIVTLASAVAFGLFYANYVNGWVSAANFDFFS